jgi:hypothetical protein
MLCVLGLALLPFFIAGFGILIVWAIAVTSPLSDDVLFLRSVLTTYFFMGLSLVTSATVAVLVSVVKALIARRRTVRQNRTHVSDEAASWQNESAIDWGNGACNPCGTSGVPNSGGNDPIRSWNPTQETEGKPSCPDSRHQ